MNAPSIKLQIAALERELLMTSPTILATPVGTNAVTGYTIHPVFDKIIRRYLLCEPEASNAIPEMQYAVHVIPIRVLASSYTVPRYVEFICRPSAPINSAIIFHEGCFNFLLK